MGSKTFLRGWAEQHEFAVGVAALSQKWVVSRSSKSVGPNATLVTDRNRGSLRHLKNDSCGEIAVS